jgi:uncharacterized OB-fold protein
MGAMRRPDRTMGSPHDSFWVFCAARELRIQRCARCQHYQWPPDVECDACAGIELDWALMSGRGTVRSWCTFERSYYEECAVPWDVLYVELDEGPMFISNPADGLASMDLADGLRVKVSFVEAADAQGEFLLPVFERSP